MLTIFVQSCNRVSYSTVFREYPDLNVFKNLNINWVTSKSELISIFQNKDTNTKLYSADTSDQTFQYITFVDGEYLGIPVRTWDFVFFYDHLWRVNIFFDVNNNVEESKEILNKYFIENFGKYVKIKDYNKDTESYATYKMMTLDTNRYICDFDITTHLDSTKNIFLMLRFQNNHYNLL